jgi:hypothetical protein
MSGLGQLQKNAFDEKDPEKLVELLNFMTEYAKFEIGVKETIKFYSLLSWSQTVLLEKIKANVMGPPKVISPETPEPEESPKPSKGKKK